MIQYKNFLIKREQSRAGSRFAECEKSRLKAKLMMTLALLLTAATGAWAAPKFGVTEITPDMVPASWANDNSGFTRNFLPGLLDNLTVNDVKPWSGMPSGDVFLIYKYTQSTGRYGYTKFNNGSETGGGVMGTKRELYLYVNNYKVYYATAYVEPDPNIIPVTPVAGQENQWEFDMPGSDVVLTPIYSVATVLGDDDTERSFASLKEAFANVQNGDVIKLDWNVTLTEQVETSTIAGGAEFTLDFNGYTIDGNFGIYLNNVGDRLVFTDSSNGEVGGYIAGDLLGVTGSVFAFDAGRFKFGSNTAETLNEYCATPDSPWELADGKEFVDIENAPDADGFNVRVAYKDIELTIGAGRFATFYMDQNVTLADGTDTNIGLYTIEGSGINLDNNTVTVTKVNDPIALAGMPLLVYNGTDAQQTVKLKVTPVAPTAGQMWSSHFQGTATDKTFDAVDMAANDYYALSGGKAFAPVKGTGTLGKNKCWLEFPKNSNNARSLTIVFDNETTGVNEVIEVNGVSDDTLYDLNGRKIQKPARKGVYIKNGQKVVR